MVKDSRKNAQGDFVKAKRLLLFVSFIGASAVSAFGQIDCTNSSKLVCQLPVTSSIINASGLLNGSSQVSGYALPINAAFATQLTQLPVPSATVGAVNIRQKGNEFGTPYQNLGPILTDRPDTVGRGHLFGGFSYQHFNFTKIDGIDLTTVPFAYTATITNSTTNDTQTFFGSVNNDVSFKLDQYVALLTYGITRQTDVSVVVPINSVTLDVTAFDFKTYLYDSATNQYINESLPTSVTAKTTGSATGLGDITINFKEMIHGIDGSPSAVSVGGIARFPSGDALNYLGSGAFGFNAYGLFSYRAAFSPHLKLSYQWNGRSVLVNPQTTSYGTKALPGGLQYALGADYKVIPRLTIAVDLLGNQFVNTPSLSPYSLALTPKPPSGGAIPTSLSGVTESFNTYTTANLSTGLKVSVWKGLIAYGNVLFQLNNSGIRSDPVPLVGISYHGKVAK